MEFLVSFDIYPSQFNTSWRSVIHFTNNSEEGKYGERIPGIWFSPNCISCLQISASVNDSHDFPITTPKIDLHQWSNLEVSQIFRKSVYVYTIKLKGNVIYSGVNYQAQSFYNVKVYASDPWHDAQDGFIRNLFIINGNDLHLFNVLYADNDKGTNLTDYCNWANINCKNTNGSYSCTCKSGWKLSNNSCVDIDECENNCNWTNSNCTNTDGSYNCTCQPGWRLVNSSCVDIDECENNCNWTNSNCTNTDGSYNCTCQPGWRLVNSSCVDIDECENNCNWTNSNCTNTDGSYNCTCQPGWRLVNSSCVDIDECENNCNWTNSNCTNTDGSYNCTCQPGWRLVNSSCVDINECNSLTDNCNLTNNVCVNSIGSYNCYKGEWSTWSECSKTCGSGYKYSFLNEPIELQQEHYRSLTCMKTKCPVDGVWSHWTTDQSCSNSFCNCSIRLERYCNNPAPDAGGYDCFGINVRYLENNKICQVNGGWTQWTPWSLCSQPCQNGVKTRYRSCTNPVPKNGGLPCNGSNTDKIPCFLDKCKNVTVNFGIIFTDENYNESEKLEGKIKTAIQNLYKKFNKTVPFNLKLNSMKNVNSYWPGP
ncbi:fibrillin-1 isoform X2 [Hydra vulgaris]|uniref:fibrillin-1 isoform X2 n=1 Tax=Hydra vulgaris TaxID=6087 RepID=UPI0032EA4B28